MMSTIGSENISSNLEPTVSTPLIPQLPPPEEPPLGSLPQSPHVPDDYDAVHHKQQFNHQQYQPQSQPQPQQMQPQPQQMQPQPQHCQSGGVVPSVSVSSPSMVNDDIPRTEKGKIFLLIGLFVAYTFVLFLNFILSIVGAAISLQQYTWSSYMGWMISTTVLSIVWLLVLPVAALFGWLLPIYYAYKKHNLFCFIWFFMVMVVQCLVWLIIPIGTPTINVGVLQGIIVYSASVPFVVVCIVISGLWLLMVIGGVIAIISIMIYVVCNYKLSFSRQVTVNQPQLNQVY